MCLFIMHHFRAPCLNVYQQFPLLFLMLFPYYASPMLFICIIPALSQNPKSIDFIFAFLIGSLYLLVIVSIEIYIKSRPNFPSIFTAMHLLINSIDTERDTSVKMFHSVSEYGNELDLC